MKREKAELLKKIHGGQTCQIVSTATRLGLFDIVYNAPHTLESLAATLSMDVDPLQRLLSALVALYLLEVGENGSYFITGQGKYLAAGHEDSLKSLAAYKGSPIVWDALGKMYEGMKQNTSPFELQFGTDLFSHLSSNEAHMDLFQDAMDCYTEQSSSALLRSYPFDQFATILDIGGGRGSFIKKLQKMYPSLLGATLDLPQTLKKVHNGITPIPGSFFDEIPTNYDGYMLRNILHDWSDEKCITILKNIRKFISEDTPLLIIEAIVEKSAEKRLGKFADLTMFMMTPGGKERSLEEFIHLFSEAGFSIHTLIRTTGSKALIDVRRSHLSS